MRNERGIVLLLSLMVLTILSIMGLAFLGTAITESNISTNYRDHTSAFFIAEGGTERARQVLVTTDIPALLLAGGNLFTDEPFGGGTYSVTVEGRGDANRLLVITSVGRLRRARGTVQIVVERNGGFSPNGAVYLPGTVGEVETKFGTLDLFTITGNDTNLDGTPGTCVAGPGIATTDDALTAAITDGNPFTGGLAPFQFDNVTGAGLAPSVQNINITYDIQAVMTELLTYPHIIVPSGIVTGDRVWGNSSNPMITYIDATTVEITGNVTGSGVLMMPGTLKVKTGASLNFNGLVIVFDEISLQPGAPVNILGTLWLEASDGLPPKMKELDPQGPANIAYSCEAIDVVNANWASAFGGNQTLKIVSWTTL